MTLLPRLRICLDQLRLADLDLVAGVHGDEVAVPGEVPLGLSLVGAVGDVLGACGNLLRKRQSWQA